LFLDKIKASLNFHAAMADPVSYPLPSRCGFCGGPMQVERLRCASCGTGLEGRFSAGWIEALSPEQSAFARVFLECRGKIKDVEQALGISYPTVVARLDEVVAALARAASPAGQDTERRLKRKAILDDLAEGTIDAEEAARRLREAS
jgi:hypothetical protein